MSTVKTLEYRDGVLYLLDQTRLPAETVILECRDYSTVAEAIKRLSVRGAPAIGLAAAYGLAVAADALISNGVHGADLRAGLQLAARELAATRPTAVNLFWAIARIQAVIDAAPEGDDAELLRRIESEADTMLREDEAANRRMGSHAATLIPDGADVLTHCNAGALAVGAFGTALGAIYAACDEGKKVHVWVDETRPLLQGARLTAWELARAGVDCTLITDSMAGHFMARGRIDLVVVGADRVAANGDTANKIGTYSAAALAHLHGLPFYVVAPTSTVDLQTPTGDAIAIEERAPEEVAGFRDLRVAPAGVRIANPAFDVTPHTFITAIITEQGIVRPPYEEGLAQAVRAATQTVVRTHS